MSIVILTKTFGMNDFRIFDSCYNSFSKREDSELFIIRRELSLLLFFRLQQMLPFR